MIKKILMIAFVSATLIGNTGCTNGGFKKYKGIEYKIIKDVKGKNAQVGDIIEFNWIAKLDTMVLADSRKQQNGQPARGPVEEPKMSGMLFPNVFTKLSAGDSVLVLVSCDTLIKLNPLQPGQTMPPWLKKGKKINVSISVLSIKSKEEMKKEMAEKAEKQKANDDKLLQDYFANNNIKTEKTASGLYYTIQKPGTGATITAGQTVSMKYTGKTLDGKIFDSNVDTAISHHGEPLTFSVGAHQMIPGVDEGAALLKKGSKATLYLPSPLAYGEQGPPNIGPNAILIFDVEITDVKDGAQGASASQQ